MVKKGNIDGCHKIVVSNFKGGTGKSSYCLLLGFYLVKYLHRHVLFIDTDPQGNLSSMFVDTDSDKCKEHSLYKAYLHDKKDRSNPKWDLTPLHVNDKIDLITATGNLANIDTLMRTRSNFKAYVIYHYLASIHADDKYDDIIIDTHNNYNLGTQNALVVADDTLIPISASRFSVDSIEETLNSINYLKKVLINPITNKTLITSKVAFVGNMIPASTNIGNQMMGVIHSNSHFIAYLHKRELINKANFMRNSVYEQASTTHDKEIIKDEINPTMNKIVDYINK